MGKVLVFPAETTIESSSYSSRTLRCSEVFHGCDFVARGAGDEEVVAQAVQHAQFKHCLTKIDWALLARFCSAIRQEREARIS